MRQDFHKGRVVLYGGDCLDVLKTLADNSLDSCVTDPPYELGFMGKKWDGTGIANNADMWREVFRVLKPGAHLVAFSGTRTYHRMACAIDDAGFEMRDMLQWLYGSGFPKSHDVSKGIDKAIGAEREKVRVDASLLGNPPNLVGGAVKGDDRPWRQSALERGFHEKDSDTPASDAAREWHGWGTALKPACEPIAFARKPLSEKTVAANVLKHGTGAIHVDACRIATDDGYTENAVTQGINTAQTSYAPAVARRTFEPSQSGRWPANIIHDGSDEVVSAFPETSSGAIKAGTPYNYTNCLTMGASSGVVKSDFPADQGSAARFFYSAKADAEDRIGSKHPTVKPVDLMRWLVRLVTPKGGTILEPFAGTGTTGAAAFLEGFNAVLIEREAEYQADIARRMALLLAGPDERARESLKARGKDQGHDDLPLFIPTPAPKAKQEAMDL